MRLRPSILLAMVSLSPAAPVFSDDTAVVLMYHRFGEDRFPSTSIRTEQFEAHLQHLREGGYSVVPLADVLGALDGERKLPPKAVAITIDDAYRSVYDVAFPRLAAHGMPFTVFVATDAVDQGLPAYMTWDQMREMAAKGASFANHGASHSSMLELTPEEIRADVEKCWKRLSAELKPLPGAFAYPYGEYDTEGRVEVTRGSDRTGLLAEGVHGWLLPLRHRPRKGCVGPIVPPRPWGPAAPSHLYSDAGSSKTWIDSPTRGRMSSRGSMPALFRMATPTTT